MKKNIHPTLHQVAVNCACGNVMKTLSVSSENYSIEICSQCHPFFTGKQKLVDTEGRIERFQKKYAKAFEAKKNKAAKNAE